MNEVDITPDLLGRYLTIYIGEANWQNHLKTLWRRVKQNSELYKKTVAATILLPTVTKYLNIAENPETLLFGITRFEQFNQHDWTVEFRKVLRRDEKIRTLREGIKKIGWIEPIDFAPYTRQAYNWLYLKAEDAGATKSNNNERIQRDFKQLVGIYGGTVICNIFTRHEPSLEKVTNWRSGYFFEHTIHDVYKPEDIFKIKKAELDGTNAKLIKRPHLKTAAVFTF